MGHFRGIILDRTLAGDSALTVSPQPQQEPSLCLSVCLGEAPRMLATWVSYK